MTDNLFPFNLEKEEPFKFTPRIGEDGKMYLQSVEGGTIYLFRGSLSAEDCKKQIEKGNFHLAAAVGQESCFSLESNIGEVTVYSPAAAIGYLKTSS